MACLYVFITVRSISPASILVSLTRRLPIPKSRGNVIVTTSSKAPRSSPTLNRYTLHIANKHCTPAKTEPASFALSSWIVMLRKSGHFAGKSYESIFWRVGMSWARIWGGEAARTGMRRCRKDVFSSSGIGLAEVWSSTGFHPRVMRFFR